MHHFKCHSARTCNTWAKGGPINNDEVSHDWQSRNEAVIEEIPTVNVGGGAIAGLGVGPQGEPGLTPAQQKKYKKKNLKQLLQDVAES
jgi:hypothetical protein